MSSLAKQSQVSTKAAHPRRLRVAEEAASILRNAILRGIDGAFAPGTQLTEVSTSRELEVHAPRLGRLSAFSLRRAWYRYRHTAERTYRRYKPDDVREIFRVRRTLELGAVEQIGHAPTDTLSLLRDAIQQMAHADDAGRWQDIVSADLLSHERLVRRVARTPLVKSTTKWRRDYDFACSYSITDRERGQKQ